MGNSGSRTSSRGASSWSTSVRFTNRRYPRVGSPASRGNAGRRRRRIADRLMPRVLIGGRGHHDGRSDRRLVGRAGVRVRGAARRPGDARVGERVDLGRGTEVGMPRIGVEAVADQWDTHDIQVNIGTGDGRVFNMFAAGQGARPVRRRRQAARARRGAVVVRAGRAVPALADAARRARVREHVARSRSPGSARRRAERAGRHRDRPAGSGAAVGERRRCCPRRSACSRSRTRARSWAAPASSSCRARRAPCRLGDNEYAIDGGALRIRRQGIRRLGTFRGHAWQSALFPSGRGFGYIVYPERDDGLPTYNEGYVFEGDGALIPAWVVDAPWLRRTCSRAARTCRWCSRPRTARRVSRPSR